LTSASNSVPAGFTFVSGIAFDPTHKAAGLTLSNGNLTVTSSNVNAPVLTTYNFSSNDKVMISFTVLNNSGWGDNMSVGITENSIVAGQIGYTGLSPKGFGFFDDGVFYVNGNGVGNSINIRYQVGVEIDMAIDMTNKRAWLRVNNGNWNSAGGNPSANVGGYSFVGL
jgi:hypothetical protein